MKCADLEILLCDYVDGTLTAPERATVQAHLDTCASCRELVADATAATEFMQRVPAVEAPPALVNKILFEARDGNHAPAKKKGTRGWFRAWVEPILQPRFAMGMAMTILSFSMLGRFAGITPRQLKASDLEPAKIWAGIDDKLHRTWDRAKKYYESLRVVYEIQNALKEWGEADEEARKKPAQETPAPAAEGPIERQVQGENPGSGRVTK